MGFRISRPFDGVYSQPGSRGPMPGPLNVRPQLPQYERPSVAHQSQLPTQQAFRPQQGYNPGGVNVPQLVGNSIVPMTSTFGYNPGANPAAPPRVNNSVTPTGGGGYSQGGNYAPAQPARNSVTPMGAPQGYNGGGVSGGYSSGGVTLPQTNQQAILPPRAYATNAIMPANYGGGPPTIAPPLPQPQSFLDAAAEYVSPPMYTTPARASIPGLTNNNSIPLPPGVTTSQLVNAPNTGGVASLLPPKTVAGTSLTPVQQQMIDAYATLDRQQPLTTTAARRATPGLTSNNSIPLNGGTSPLMNAPNTGGVAGLAKSNAVTGIGNVTINNNPFANRNPVPAPVLAPNASTWR